MPVITNLNELLKQFVDERIAIHHMSGTNTTDPEGDFATAGETDTYTFWADAAETVNLGYFSVTNGYTSDGYMITNKYDTNDDGIVNDSDAVGGKDLVTLESDRDLAISNALDTVIDGAPTELNTLGKIATELGLKLDASVYTAEDVKTKYESNADTNVFTDAEKTKLGNLAANIISEW